MNTEPVSPHENAPELSQLSTLPKGIKECIEILETYKRNIINHYTIINKDPKALLNLPIIISKKGNELIEYLRTRQSYEYEDDMFKEVKKSLEPYINPWNAEVSTLLKYYVNKLFIESSSLTPSIDHINTLKRNAAL